jgi:hypothetical protein
MRRISLYLASIIILFFAGGCNSTRFINIAENTINLPVTFFMQVDSIPNTYKIDSNGTAIIGSDNLNLYGKGILLGSYDPFYKGFISSYLYLPDKKFTGYYTIMEFYKGRLFEISIYSSKPYYLSNIKIELQRDFHGVKNGEYEEKLDSFVDRNKYKVEYGLHYTNYSFYGHRYGTQFSYSEDLVSGHGYVIYSDQKFINLMPSWCGVSNGRRTWWKLDKYVKRRVKKLYWTRPF